MHLRQEVRFMKKPNLFIVGQPKSGTTSIYHYLKQHPEIFMPEQKELHHFAKDLNEERKKKFAKKNEFNFSLNKYLSHFIQSKNEKYLGDITPDYLYSKLAAKEIYKFKSEAKIIAIFREPVNFLYSLYSQYYYTLNEKANGFKKALELEPARKKGKSVPFMVREPSMLFYSEKIKYTIQLKRYFEVFPKKNIKVIIFEEFKNNPRKIIKEIFDFLEIESSFKPKLKVHNPNKSIRLRFLQTIIYSKLIWKLPKKILPRFFYDKIKNLMHKIFITHKKRKPLNSKFKKTLKKRYKNEVKKFNEFLHKNKLLPKRLNLIKLWGYEDLNEKN